MAKLILDDDSDLDEYLKRYLETCVTDQIRAVLAHQLKNIVAGELARLQLTNTSSGPLEQTVRNALVPLIDARLRVILGPMAKDQLRIIMDQATSPK